MSDLSEAVLDQLSFMRTVNAFKMYRSSALSAMEQRRHHMLELSEEHRALLPFNIDELFGSYERGIAMNQAFFDAVVEASEGLFRSYWPNASMEAVACAGDVTPSALDIEKVYSTLRQVVRDWGVEGAVERDAAYGPLIRYIAAAAAPNVRGSTRILVPGAGLSRLSVELACLGFCAVGNEFSYHMLIVGHFLMNHVADSGAFRLCPFVDTTCNLIHRHHQFHTTNIPDRSTYDMVTSLEAHDRPFGELSMIAGDFTEVYARESEKGRWDVVCTSFFLDTAHNIMQYLSIVYDLLVPGGVLVNVGPLLYHFSGSTNEPSVELSLDEVVSVAQRIGFEVVVPPQLQQATYTNNATSMKQLVYVVAFFVLQHPKKN